VSLHKPQALCLPASLYAPPACSFSHQQRCADAFYVDETGADSVVWLQVKDTLGAIAARFKALHIGGGGLFVGRLLAPHARPLSLKSVVRYSPNWVKNQNRMASTSNQETYRTDVDGRLVFDILRQVLSSHTSLLDYIISNPPLTSEVWMIVMHEILVSDDPQTTVCATCSRKQRLVFPVVLSMHELLQLLHTAWQTIPLSCCNVTVAFSGSTPSAHAVHTGRRF